MNGAADQFTFVYRSLRGDATVIAKLDTLQNVNPWSQAGVMIRESLDERANHGYVLASAANGLAFRTRKSARNGTSQMAAGAGSAPVWLKLERRASSLTASRSVDGVNWTTIGAVKLQLSQTVLVGLVTASHTAGATATATLSNVSVNGINALDAPVSDPSLSNVWPTVSLSSPANGAAFPAFGTISIGATAGDIDGTVNKVDFYAGASLLGSDTTSPYSFNWSNVPAGSYALKAVATDNLGAFTESATVNVTVNANTAPTVSMTSPGTGATFAAPATIALAATAADPGGSIARVDFYNGATLLTSDTSSPYSFNWTNVSAGSYALRAVATDNAGASTQSAIVTVTVNANTAPTVSMTSPGAGATFAAPATMALAATAADPGGSIARVDFYNGATLLTSDTSSPYSFDWTSVPAGSYALRAMAFDNAGASTQSAIVNVTVNANTAPTVSMTSPVTGATFTAPATISLMATASDADGSIQQVDFYSGSTLLGTSTTSPYSFTWLNVPLGSYSVSAVAKDDRGATTVSSWQDISVTNGVLSKAIFTPAVVPDPVDRYVFEVYAAGADPSVAIPIAAQDLGVPPVVNNECTADIKDTILALAPGSYIATVSAISSADGTLRSTPAAFTR